MKNCLINKRFLYILLLISLVGFLVLPKICLADDFENITLTEIDKYLELPAGKVEELLRSLINIFYSEWTNLMGSGYSTAEQMAVPIIMREAARVQALNHLLTDAPLETTWKIIKAAIDIVKIYINPSAALEKLEKLSVEKAIEEGKKQLFQNEVRVTPGAIAFKYTSRKREEKIALFQYVIIYQPIDNKNGKILIRFYSTEPLEPPKNKGSYGMAVGMYTELTDDLPPFIVDIQGLVENYQWKGNPSVNIDFPPEVPDLGIKLLTPLEKYLLKPIETTIKEVEVIITKVTGRSLGLTDIWNEIKSFISKITNFSPAAIVGTEINRLSGMEQGGPENISNILNLQTEKLSPDNLIEVEPQSDETEIKQEPEQKLTLEEIQEILDDISEKIDIISQEIVVLTVSSQPVSKENQKTVKKEEISEEETEEEIILTNAENSEIDQKLCPIISGITPLRNKVIFNEIAWMGGVNSANDEWIELKNISGTEINFSGWQLFDKDGQIKIVFTNRGRSSANGFFLLERTDDKSVSGIAADLIYTGNLSNTNESLYLFDENCQLQDEVSANPNWPAGDNSSKKTMERKYDLTWQTSADSMGTPKRENSIGYYVSSSGGGGAPPPSQPSPTYPKILISEIQVDGLESSDDEFIELYNPNEEKVSLGNWSIQRAPSSGTIYKKNFESSNTIPAKGYFLIVNKHANQTLLELADMTHVSFDITTGNTIFLVTNQEKIVSGEEETILDKVGWWTAFSPEGNSAPGPLAGESIGRKWSTATQSYIDTDNNQADFEIQTPTPKTQNQSPQPAQNQLPIASFIYSPANPIVNQEILFNSSSSTDPGGTITSYIWDFGDSTTSTEIKATTTHFYSTSSNFLVSLTVVDNNNATGSATTTIIIITPETPTLEVVINEIQIDSIVGDGGAEDDWVELYNPTNQDIPLASWSIQRHTSTGKILEKKNFEPNHIIPARGYFLIVRNEANDNLKMIADMTCSALQLSSSNTVYLVSNDEYIESGDDPNIVDKVGFGQGAFSPEGNPAPNPPEGKSIERKELGLDTDDNSSDFEIKNPSPTNSKGESGPTILTNYQIAEDTTFSIQGSPYIVQNTLTILEGKTLTVEPGATLKFYDNAGLNVNGTLRAIGQENKKIIFTSFFDSGRWKYINFASSSVDSVLENCLIKNLSYAENQWAISIVSTSVIFENSNIEDTAANVIQLNNSSSSINNLTIKKNSTGVAMEILGGAPEIKNSKFIDTYAGMFIEEGSRATIIGNYFEGIDYPLGTVVVDGSYPILKENQGTTTNLTNGIYLYGAVTQNWQLGKNEDFPYIISSLTNLASTTLEINPGVVIKFKEGGKLEIHGTLKAEGTDNEKILFTSLQGYSGEISFVSESASSSLKNVILEYGNSSGVVKVSNTNVYIQNAEFRHNNVGLLLENSSSTVSGCTFTNNIAVAIEISGGAHLIENSNFDGGVIAIKIQDSFAKIKGNTFQNFTNGSGVISVKNGYPDFERNTFQNNAANVVSLIGTINSDWTLTSDISYLINWITVAKNKTLIIEPGTVIEFMKEGLLEVYGTLKAEGEEENKISFTTTVGSYWQMIHFLSQDTTSTLKYATIERGGVTCCYLNLGAVRVEKARVELENLYFGQNSIPNIYFIDSLQSSLNNSQFNTASSSAIKIEGESPSIQWSTLSFP